MYFDGGDAMGDEILLKKNRQKIMKNDYGRSNELNVRDGLLLFIYVFVVDNDFRRSLVAQTYFYC